MIAIKARVETEHAKRMIRVLANELKPEKIDFVVDKAALLVQRNLVEATVRSIGVRPDGTRWNLQKPERKWIVTRPAPGVRVISNADKVAKFLDEGTAQNGSGFIYPRRKKMLFVPLRRVAGGGWYRGLKRGTDYVLAKRVRGMRGRRYVEPERERAVGILLQEMKAYVNAVVTKASNG